MPRYEFKCPSCGLIAVYELDVADRNTDTKCPSCERLMERQITVPSIAFKGTGWTEKGSR